MMLYRRSEAEMPGRAEEIHHAKDEGVEIHTLHPPRRVPRRREGLAAAARAASGWRSASRTTPAVAGRCRSRARSSRSRSTWRSWRWAPAPTRSCSPRPPTSPTNKKGYIAVADQETLRTSKKGVFAGGDIVTGAATVILAMGAGRKAVALDRRVPLTGTW